MKHQLPCPTCNIPLELRTVSPAAINNLSSVSIVVLEHPYFVKCEVCESIIGIGIKEIQLEMIAIVMGPPVPKEQLVKPAEIHIVRP